METQIDLIANGKTIGDIAGYLAAHGRIDFGRKRPFIDEKTGLVYVTSYRGGDPTKKASYVTQQIQLVDNSNVLRRDEWKALDAAILEPSRYRLGAIEDLISKNLVYTLGNPMGSTVFEWHDVSEAGEAEMTMNAVTRTKGDRPVFQHNYLPIPIIHYDYELDERTLAASRNMGNALDTTMAERAARKVNEFLEDLLVTDTTFGWGETDTRGRNTIYSYLNHPDRNLVNLSIPWDNSAATASGILQDVLEMVQAAVNAYHRGPYMLYIPMKYQTVLYNDYDVTTPGTTIRERILKIEVIQGIKVIDSLPDDNVVLVQMTPDVVRLVRGFGLQNVQWSTEGGMVHKFKVMTIQVPQIRSDQNGKSGIVHLS